MIPYKTKTPRCLLVFSFLSMMTGVVSARADSQPEGLTLAPTSIEVACAPDSYTDGFYRAQLTQLNSPSEKFDGLRVRLILDRFDGRKLSACHGKIELHEEENLGAPGAAFLGPEAIVEGALSTLDSTVYLWADAVDEESLCNDSNNPWVLDAYLPEPKTDESVTYDLVAGGKYGGSCGKVTVGNGRWDISEADTAHSRGSRHTVATDK
jgi:hypothetical protein